LLGDDSNGWLAVVIERAGFWFFSSDTSDEVSDRVVAFKSESTECVPVDGDTVEVITVTAAGMVEVVESRFLVKMQFGISQH
jgi:hypothetical protein